MKKIFSFHKKLAFTSLALLSIVGYSVVVFAAAPSGGYTPGQTLNPDCAPGDTDCIVKLPAGGVSSGWSLDGNTVLGGIPSSINTSFSGTGLDDITMTGPFTGDTPVTWVIVITATGTPDQMEVIIEGDSEYVGDVFPPGPFPVDDGLTLNFGSDTGHTVGDTWTFTMTPGSGGTTAFLGTLNNEDLIFKTNSTEAMRLTSAGDLQLLNYNNNRDNSGSDYPNNFLYTDNLGNLKSAPTSLLLGSGGGSSDGSLYLNDGALTGNRTLDGDGNNLTFTNVNNFSAVSLDKFGVVRLKTTGLGESILDGVGSEETLSGLAGVSLVSENITLDNKVTINATAGISGFSGADNKVTFNFINSGFESRYAFPNTDGTAGQVLTSDGSGQLSWVTPTGGGGSDGNIYDNNGTLSGNRTLDGGFHNLFFNDVHQFIVKTEDGSYNPAAIGILDLGLGHNAFILQANSLDDHGSYISSDFGNLIGETDWDDLKLSLLDYNINSDYGAAVGIESENGVRFRFKNSGIMSQYYFPRTDGTAGQVLTSDGSGQLSWATPSDGGANWSLIGNVGTDGGINNFLGTTDNTDLTFKTNNIRTGFISNDGLSIQFGANAGASSASRDNTIFLGPDAGSSATGADDSVFIGVRAGKNATAAYGSTFVGSDAGAFSATSTANYASFFGAGSGYQAKNAAESTFIGSNTGTNAQNADHSTFIGAHSGHGAIYSAYSIFLGINTGSYDSTSFIGSQFAAKSIFIGNNAGFTSNDYFLNNTTNPDDFSILLGNNTSTGGNSNSIAIGGSAVNTASNQFMIGSTTRPINETRFQGSVIGTQCTITTGTGIACTSDERLKTNIVDLNSDTLTKLQNIRTVNYNLIGDTSNRYQVGFLAQNLEQYFPELVDTNSDGYKSVYYAQMTPILTKAIQEMNLNITTLSDMTRINTWRDSLIAWFGNVGNGINDFFTKTSHTETLCVGTTGSETCITKTQLDQLLNNNGSNPVVISATPDPTTTPNPDPIINEIITDPASDNDTGDTVTNEAMDNSDNPDSTELE